MWKHDANCFLLFPSITDEQANPGEASRQRESRRYLIPFLPPPPCVSTFLLVPGPQTCCLRVSASPLSVPLDDALHLDTGWQHGLAGPSRIQNTLCKQCSGWLAQPPSPSIELHHMHERLDVNTQFLVLLRRNAGHLFLSNTFNKTVTKKENPVWLMP